MLHADVPMRVAWVNKAETPIANKTLACGMIP
jgi:hypothetical protein